MLALIPQSSLHSNDLYNEIYNAPLQHSDPIPLHQGVHDVATLFMQGGPGFNDLLTPTYVWRYSNVWAAIATAACIYRPYPGRGASRLVTIVYDSNGSFIWQFF